MTDEFLQEVAQHYLENVNSGDKKRPLAYVAEQYGAPKQTVRKWIKLSRQRGFLPELGQGRAWICDVTANKLAIQRVRELAKELLKCDCEHTCEFKVAGMSINKALDGEQE
jgi:transposase-like protein